MNTTKNILTVGLCILAISCNYKLTIIKDVNDKRYLQRVYKTTAQQEIYLDRSVFKRRYVPKHYDRYQGKIDIIYSDSLDSFPEVQFDSVRIGFGNFSDRYIDIFTTGILNSNIIYCYEDSLCKPKSPAIERYPVIDGIISKVPSLPAGEGYRHYISVGLIEEPKHLKVSPKRRRFKLWINTNQGAHGFKVYLIELSNEKVNSYIDIKEFVKAAKLTFITSTLDII